MLTEKQRKFEELLRKNHRYGREAYRLVYKALEYTLEHVVKRTGHVSAHELLGGFRLYAIEQFGCLARTVMNGLKIRKTNDIGELVFILTGENLMEKQESDRQEEFNNVYDFDEVFDLKPVSSYASDTREWKTDYVQRKTSKKGKADNT